MDSFARAKLKSENCDLRTQLEELNNKLDIVNSSLNKYIQINQKQEQLILNLDEKYNSLKVLLREELNQSHKFTQLISFIKLKNKIIEAAKIGKEDQNELFINQFIINNQNDEILKKIFPIGCRSKDRYRFYCDLRELYNRLI
jgi:hypothetical protein